MTKLEPQPAARLFIDSASWLRAYREPDGWRVERHARRWGGQAWDWKPVVAHGATVAAATRAVIVGNGFDYGVDVDGLAAELERRATVTADPEPEL